MSSTEVLSRTAQQAERAVELLHPWMPLLRTTNLSINGITKSLTSLTDNLSIVIRALEERARFNIAEADDLLLESLVSVVAEFDTELDLILDAVSKRELIASDDLLRREAKLEFVAASLALQKHRVRGYDIVVQIYLAIALDCSSVGPVSDILELQDVSKPSAKRAAREKLNAYTEAVRSPSENVQAFIAKATSLLASNVAPAQEDLEDFVMVDRFSAVSIGNGTTSLSLPAEMATEPFEAKAKEVLETHYLRLDDEHHRNQAMWWASLLDFPKLLSFLINKGINLESPVTDDWCTDMNNKYKEPAFIGETALTIAVRSRSTKCVRLLLDAGAKAQFEDTGYMDLSFVLANAKCIELVLGAGAKKEVSALTLAISLGYSEVVKVLLRNGYDAYGCEKEKEYPMLTAVEYGRRNIIQLLLAEKIDINRIYDRKTALGEAAEGGQRQCVLTLLEYGADPSILSEGSTPLAIAAGGGEIGCMGWLMMWKADLNQIGEKYTALMEAAMGSQLEAIKLLLAQGADPNVRGDGDRTALMFAAKHSTFDCVKALIEGGADVNAVSTRAYTALMYAAAGSDDSGIVEELIKAGASLDSVDDIGQTALFYALKHSYNHNLGALLDAGADHTIVPEDGYDLVMFAAMNNLIEGLKILIEKSADCNRTTRYGKTALTLAMKEGHTECIKILLNAGADLYIDSSADRVLRKAISNGYIGGVQALLEAGYDLNRDGKSGASFLDKALEKGHASIADLLRGAGATTAVEETQASV